jgi:hypothetical protein
LPIYNPVTSSIPNALPSLRRTSIRKTSNYGLCREIRSRGDPCDVTLLLNGVSTIQRNYNTKCWTSRFIVGPFVLTLTRMAKNIPMQCFYTRDVPWQRTFIQDVPKQRTFSQQDVPRQRTFSQQDVPRQQIFSQQDVPRQRTLSQQDVPRKRTYNEDYPVSGVTALPPGK